MTTKCKNCGYPLRRNLEAYNYIHEEGFFYCRNVEAWEAQNFDIDETDRRLAEPMTPLEMLMREE